MNSLSWLSSLNRGLPTILVQLLGQKEGESLERLQLIQVEIKLLESTEKPEVSLERHTEGADHFLSLHGVLHGAQPLDVRIRYFVRGQRKFYKPNLVAPENYEMNPWLTIDRDWVIHSLNADGQDNSALFSRELAQLNGRKDIQVPSHLVLSAALAEAAKIWPADRAPLSYFVVNFLGGIELDSTLLKGVLLGESSLELVLAQNNASVILVKAS